MNDIDDFVASLTLVLVTPNVTFRTHIQVVVEVLPPGFTMRGSQTGLVEQCVALLPLQSMAYPLGLG